MGDLKYPNATLLVVASPMTLPISVRQPSAKTNDVNLKIFGMLKFANDIKIWFIIFIIKTTT